MHEKIENIIIVHKCVSTASKQMHTPTKTQSTNSMLHKNGNLRENYIPKLQTCILSMFPETCHATSVPPSSCLKAPKKMEYILLILQSNLKQRLLNILKSDLHLHIA